MDKEGRQEGRAHDEKVGRRGRKRKYIGGKEDTAPTALIEVGRKTKHSAGCSFYGRYSKSMVRGAFIKSC